MHKHKRTHRVGMRVCVCVCARARVCVCVCVRARARACACVTSHTDHTCAQLLARPPQEYDEAIDMWAVGCVLGELLRHAPLFPASSELECLRMQCALLGSPGPQAWPVSSTVCVCVCARACVCVCVCVCACARVRARAREGRGREREGAAGMQLVSCQPLDHTHLDPISYAYHIPVYYYYIIILPYYYITGTVLLYYTHLDHISYHTHLDPILDHRANACTLPAA